MKKMLERKDGKKIKGRMMKTSKREERKKR